MTNKEERIIEEQFLKVYAGILYENPTFAGDNEDEVCYRFDCPEFVTLKEKYGLETIAGTGSDFTRAKRLLHYLAPRLHHASWYDNHVPCNARDLLEYSLDNPEQGINCLNKSKILEECCLAVGIYARRVGIMPYSPYDFDNHVVTEIYDRKLQKWIMLDPTTDGFFVDEEKTPLSLIEMRRKFASDELVTFAPSTSRLKDVQKLQAKNADTNMYICKNLFYFTVDKESKFGEPSGALYFVPQGYSLKGTAIANAQYRLRRIPQEYADLKPRFEETIVRLQKETEPPRTAIASMEKAPL